MRTLIVSTLLLSGLMVQAEPLELSQAVELAVENDVRLAPYLTAKKMAEVRANSSIQRRNPELRLGYDFDSQSLGTAIRVFPKNPWANKAQERINDAVAERSASEYRLALLGVTAEVTTVFKELQFLQKEQELLSRIAELKIEVSKKMEKQLDASMGTRGMGLLVYWDALEALDAKRSIELEIVGLNHKLSSLIGSLDSDLTVTPLVEDKTFAELDADEMTMVACEFRPELQRVKADLSGAEARLKGEKNAAIPWVNHVQIGFDDGGDGGDSAIDLRVAIELPFFSVSGTEKRLAREAVAHYNMELDKREISVRSEVAMAVKRYNLAVKEWNLLKKRQASLIVKTKDYLADLGDGALVEESLKLEGKLVDAEFKQITLLRKINEAEVSLLKIIGSEI